jgi:hypothetical protein
VKNGGFIGEKSPLVEEMIRLKIRWPILIVLVFAMTPACKNPNAPDEPSVQIVVEITYVRIAPVTHSIAFELVQLSSQAMMPNNDLPDARVQDMTKIEEGTFRLSVAVWTNYTATIWVADGWLYQESDKYSYQYVAKDLFVNGQRMSKVASKGSAYWSGTVKFIIKNDGSIVQP